MGSMTWGKGRGRLSTVVITLGVYGLAGSLAAAEVAPTSYSDGVSRKLGRGLANVVTAPLELIRTPYLVSQRDGAVAGGSVGTVKGLWAAVVRELAGVVETVTCLFPIPKDFQPLIQPEFVYAHGDWVP